MASQFGFGCFLPGRGFLPLDYAKLPDRTRLVSLDYSALSIILRILNYNFSDFMFTKLGFFCMVSIIGGQEHDL